MYTWIEIIWKRYNHKLLVSSTIVHISNKHETYFRNALLAHNETMKTTTAKNYWLHSPCKIITSFLKESIVKYSECKNVYLLFLIPVNSWDVCAGVSWAICSTCPNMGHCNFATLVDNILVLFILYGALLEIWLFGYWCPVIVIRCLWWQETSLSIAAFGTAQQLQLYSIIKDTHVAT